MAKFEVRTKEQSLDSPIKLKCLPMGQWHLRADSFLPPFSSNHPLLACRRQDSAKSSSAAATTASTVDTTATTTISHVEADESTWDSRAGRCIFKV
ncbi:unnamed protein product [Dibothriocephalus latus]|uniref:Uncharacterized protein n=1 Tax=Dibothriocephalus latus TaxID=60516 RepID=A0A3P7RBZ1_DIBLA|nr:unnamed protein product [Dibothriocephalus latus]